MAVFGVPLFAVYADEQKSKHKSDFPKARGYGGNLKYYGIKIRIEKSAET